MSLRHIVQFRKLSTTRILRESFLSSDYKSDKLWKERFNCKLLGGEESLLRSVNSKIISGNPLTNWEIDMFINISTPHVDEIAQLQESAKLLKEFRKTLYAHTLLPSTPHAVCRLFLYSQKLSSLVKLLESRVEYGIFPDFFVLNLLLDQAVDNEEYMLASRLANLVMLQEEFGCNSITDRLSLLSVVKYIESKTSFEDWLNFSNQEDSVLTVVTNNTEMSEQKEEAKKEEEKNGDDDNDEEEDDAEYVRVPFLRNPYSDNHFDLTNPRVVCGKTLTLLGQTFMSRAPEIGARCSLLGSILQGRWSEAIESIEKFVKAGRDLGPMRELSTFFVENLHGIDELNAEDKSSLLSALETIPESSSQSLSELARLQCKSISQIEPADIKQLEEDLRNWSEMRLTSKKREEDRLYRKTLEAEIEAKKEELRVKEQYLYFYDNLKKSRATRIEYN